MSTASRTSEFRWVTTLGMLFVTFLLISNIIAAKPVAFGAFIIPAAILTFPLTYLISVAITEVYGSLESQKITRLAMLSSVLMAVFFYIAIALPAAQGWAYQTMYADILGSGIRIVVASLISFIIGLWFNTHILTKLKSALKGQGFWFRALLSMAISDAVGTTIFLVIAFYGALSNPKLLQLGLCYYGFKQIYVVLTIPLLSAFVARLKRLEGMST